MEHNCFTIIQNGLKPVFVDVNLSTYDINSDMIEKAIKKTKAIMLVHPLGHVCNMNKILKYVKNINCYY